MTKLIDNSDPYILFYQKHSIVESDVLSTAVTHAHDACKPDSPETQALKRCIKITPKRQQSFTPSACKLCGLRECVGACVQRL